MTTFGPGIDPDDIKEATIEHGAYRYHVTVNDVWTSMPDFDMGEIEIDGVIQRVDLIPRDERAGSGHDGMTLEDAFEGLEMAITYAAENDRTYMEDELKDLRDTLEHAAEADDDLGGGGE